MVIVCADAIPSTSYYNHKPIYSERHLRLNRFFTYPEETMTKAVDLVGQRFGRLTVIKRVENSRQGRAMWLCRCECGKESILCGGNLRSGNTNSCGCLGRETRDKFVENGTKHHSRYTRLYDVWRGMKRRCCNPKHKDYHSYGERGIAVCDEWLNSFEAFRDWALANGYDENAPKGQCTLDRIDVNGNYEPTNCRWATTKEQNSNTRYNHLITYNGETHHLSEWARIIGVTTAVFCTRLARGWSIEEVLSTPPNTRRRCRK